MKLVKKGLVALTLAGLVLSMSACSEPLPEAVTPQGGTTGVTASESETPANEQVDSAAQAKTEGPALVMIAASNDAKIEGSEGLGFYGVYAESESSEDVTEAIERGNFFATQSEDGPTIKMTCKDYKMGDTAPLSDLVKFKVEVKGVKSGSIVKVVTADGVVVEEKVMGDRFDARVEAEAKGFYRVEIYTADGAIVAISNPITVTE